MRDVVRKPCVILDGRVINIGPWDDLNGTNPMPDGAVVEEREVVQGEDGGWYVVGELKPPTVEERISAIEQALIELMMEGGGA